MWFSTKRQGNFKIRILKIIFAFSRERDTRKFLVINFDVVKIFHLKVIQNDFVLLKIYPFMAESRQSRLD